VKAELTCTWFFKKKNRKHGAVCIGIPDGGRDQIFVVGMFGFVC
jgi:hypothetical protein